MMQEPTNTPSDPPQAAAGQAQPVEAAVSQGAPVAGGRTAPAAPARGTLAFGALAVLSLVISALMWERLGNVQDQVARQTAEAGAAAGEARSLVRQSQDQERELAARQAMLEARVAELTLQRSQLDELMQSLSRSRDENLVIDIAASLRLAQQQAQLTGNVEPMLAALQSAEHRIQKAPQARLAPVLRAIARDMARIKSAPLVDTPTLLTRLDELVREVDELPLANGVGVASRPARPAGANSTHDVESWWREALRDVWDEARHLVRVSRIDEPDAVLLTPEQSFFLRENLKLLLLNARLELLARQPDGVRADLGKAAEAMGRYFDNSNSRTRTAIGLLQQTRDQLKSVQLPRVDETLAALDGATAGH